MCRERRTVQALDHEYRRDTPKMAIGRFPKSELLHFTDRGYYTYSCIYELLGCLNSTTVKVSYCRE